MLSDFRFALRLLMKQPGFTAVAVLTMAIAIGANTALFSVINAVVLRPIDYPQPDELVRVWAVNRARNVEFPAVSWPRYVYYRDNATMLASAALSVYSAVTVTDDSGAEQLPGLLATANFLPTLGLAPQLGRVFNEEEDRAGGANVALISHKVWQARYGGTPDVLGKTLTADGVPYHIIGVLPARMPVPFNQVEVIMPRPVEAPFLRAEARDGGAAVWQLTARLKPGITRAAAGRQLDELTRQLREKMPHLIDAQDAFELRPFVDEIIPARLRLASWVLVAAVGAVLLIACANIANLSLARLASRTKEIAVRASLGAGRRLIVRQFLVESLVLAVIGGTLGVLMAAWGLDAVRLLAADQLPRVDNLAIDGATLLFALGATALATLLVGVYPAWQATRTDVQVVLKDTGRGTAGSHANKRFRNALVVAEVAISLVLMIGAALLLYSFARLQRTALGFDPSGVAVGAVNLPRRDYPTPERQREFARRVQEKLDAAPELASGGVGFGVPLTNAIAFTPYTIGGQPIVHVAQRSLVGFRQVTPGYFRSLGYALKEGRHLDDGDREKTRLVGVINESLARKVAPEGSALGHTLLFGPDGETQCEIVGVVRDAKSNGVASPAPDEIYFAHAQRGNGFFHVIGKAKPGLDPAAVLPVLRRAVREVDPNVAIANPQTGAELVAQNLQATRALSALLGAFAAMAALLAIVGIYSVIACNVTQRTAEIGVRIALGATTANIFQLVLRSAGVLVGAGLFVGLAVALAASRVLRQLLYEVQPFDPVIFCVVAVAFAAVGVIAAVIPARRAALLDPLTALRAE